MATIKEQLEALAVTDNLQREENPLAGNWEGAGATNTGKATLTGWTITASKTGAGAKRKTGIALGGGVLLFIDIAVRPAVGQTIEIGFLGLSGIYIKRTGTNACEVGIYTSASVIKTLGGVTMAAGDRFAFSWESNKTVKVWRKPSAGAWAEVTSSASGETPAGTVAADMFFVHNNVTGTEGRVTNFAQGVVVSGTALKVELAETVAPIEARGNKDAVKRGDALASVAEARSKRPSLRRKDSQIVAELLKRAVKGKRADTLALSETLKRASNGKRIDTVALADKLSKALGIRRGDAAALIDAIRKGDGLRRKDSLEANESRSVRPGPRRSELAPVSDARHAGTGKVRADVVSLQELLARAWVSSLKLNSVFALDDELLANLGRELGVGDIVALSDTLVTLWSAEVELVDHLNPEDAKRLAAALRRKDTATVAEVIRKNAGSALADSSSVSAAERLAARKGLAEAFSVADAVHPAENIGLGHLAIFSDALSRAWAARLKLTSGVALSDTALRGFGAALADAILSDDNRSHRWSAVRNAQDAFEVDDDILTFLGGLEVMADEVIVVEALKRVWSALRVLADAAGAVDRFTKDADLGLADGALAFSARWQAITKGRGELFNVLDAQNMDAASNHDDLLAPVDHADRSLAKSLAEIVFAQDSRGTVVPQLLEDALDAVDAATRDLGHRSSDLFALGEQRSLALDRRRQDAVPVSDLLHHVSGLRISDQIMPLDGHLKNATLSPADAIAFADLLATLNDLGVEIDEALVIVDGLRRDSDLALLDLARVVEQAEPEGLAAHLAILALVDLLSTAANLNDQPLTAAISEDSRSTRLLLGDEHAEDDLDDRRSTTLSLEDAS